MKPARRGPRAAGEAGFTLVELLVVVLIIGILASISLPIYLNQRRKALDAAARSDLRNLGTYEESWLAAGHDLYTTTAADLTGFTLSHGVELAIGVDPSGGFCAAALSQPGNLWWYDSRAGGVQERPSDNAPGTPTCSSFAPVPLPGS